jgi:radical SAM protein (TIGR01212 family)
MQKILPYHPISEQYRKLFGEKVYKIPISLAQTCPNRDGLKGMKTCVFCDEWGSAAYPEVREMGLREQFETNKRWITSRVNVAKFLVYLQAYTNTYAKIGQVESLLREASEIPDVVGVVLGTRPDCVSASVFDLCDRFDGRFRVLVELGVQSFSDAQLRWMERGHSVEKSLWAIRKFREKCPRVNLGIHLIFGLPGETLDDVVSAAEHCNELPIDNVKLHNLHVLKGTPLEAMYRRGEFVPLEREAYAERVAVFLDHLSPDIAVHRLTALSRRHEELIAPAWTAKKMESYQFVLDYMRARGSRQGRNSRILATFANNKAVVV